MPHAAKARVLAEAVRSVPLTEALALDEAAFKAAVTEAAKAEETYLASLRELAGEGSVTGLGGGAAATDPAAKTQFVAGLVESFERLGLNSDAAKVAAGGRR